MELPGDRPRPLRVRPPVAAGEPHDVRRPPPMEIDVDVVGLLMEERRPDR